MSRLATAVVGLVLVGCGSTPTTDPAVQSQVGAAAQSWVAALNECSAEKLSALYLPDAVLWGTVSQAIISTPAGIRQYFDRACGATPPFKASLGEQLVRVHGDTAVNSGTYSFARTVDGQLRAAAARYSFTYRKVSGAWLITDHHSSLLPAPPPAAPPPSR